MLKPDDIYKKVEDKWVSRFILDEVVIMPLCRSEEDLQYIYSISNDTGTRLWQLLDGGHSVRDIQEILKSEYQGQEEVMEREVLEFIGDLVEVKLIQKVTACAKKDNVHRASSIQHPDKKNYKRPEIAKVKMQPEQAVLSCCLVSGNAKLDTHQYTGYNYCGDACYYPCDPGDCYGGYAEAAES